MRGFTLIEIVVAVAIVGIIATGLFGTFSRTISSRNYALEHATVFASARRAIDLLERDLAGVYATGSFADDFAELPPLFYADGDPLMSSQDEALVILDFTAVSSRGTTPLDGLGPLPLKGQERSDLTRILYRLEVDSAVDSQVDALFDEQLPALVRYEVRPPIADPASRGVRSVILDAVRSISFRMRGPRGSWQVDWDSRPTGTTKGRLPFLFETRLDLAVPPDGSEVFLSTVYIPAAAAP